ncbi:hypothetical protein OPV22_016946 [Ensete ventricosum]|uniref:AIR9 PH-like domain-containing protein n=1 Tax=Ensete ventricosum TaxID=4639 RepID=A0AAV8PHB6_ENSVE|nr:hypothetical protein OPV22_016946 [Ensete ventricosum]
MVGSPDLISIPEPDIYKEVKQKLELGSVKFERIPVHGRLSALTVYSNQTCRPESGLTMMRHGMRHASCQAWVQYMFSDTSILDEVCEKKILEVNRKRVKLVLGLLFQTLKSVELTLPPFHVELYHNDQHQFKIAVDNENEMVVQTRQRRDKNMEMPFGMQKYVQLRGEAGPKHFLSIIHPSASYVSWTCT